MIITCSCVSLAARRGTNPAPKEPAENAWQQQQSWQKLQKNMSPDMVRQTLGSPASFKKGASVMIWYYQKEDTEKGFMRFKGIDSVYYLFDWIEPDYAAIRRQIQAKQQAEKVKLQAEQAKLQAQQAKLRAAEDAKAAKAKADAKAAAEAKAKARQAGLEKARLAAKLKQANIQKARLARNLEAERLKKEQQGQSAKERELHQGEKTQSPKETPKEEMAGGIGFNILIIGGIAMLVLVFSYVFFFRKTYQ